MGRFSVEVTERADRGTTGEALSCAPGAPELGRLM